MDVDVVVVLVVVVAVAADVFVVSFGISIQGVVVFVVVDTV